MTDLDNLPPVLKVAELAELLRVSRNTVYEGIKAGDIPGARRVGRRVLISRDAVLRWLSQGGVCTQESEQ